MQTPIAGNLLWCLEMYSVLRGGGLREVAVLGKPILGLAH